MRETKHRQESQTVTTTGTGAAAATDAAAAVSWRALLSRLSRALKKNGTELVAPRGRRAQNGGGTYWLLREGMGRGSLKKLGEGRTVVERLARKMGVLREWESVEGGRHAR